MPFDAVMAPGRPFLTVVAKWIAVTAVTCLGLQHLINFADCLCDGGWFVSFAEDRFVVFPLLYEIAVADNSKRNDLV